MTEILETGELFEPETITYCRSSAVETRAHVEAQLRPIADKLRREGANPLAVSEAFARFRGEFIKQAQDDILSL